MPVLIAAGIAAAASLLGGMMSQKAQAEENRKNRLAEAQNMGFEAQKQGAQAMGQAEQAGSKNLMDLYRGVYL